MIAIAESQGQGAVGRITCGCSRRAGVKYAALGQVQVQVGHADIISTLCGQPAMARITQLVRHGVGWAGGIEGKP